VGELLCGMEDVPLTPASGGAAGCTTALERARPPAHVVALRGARVHPPPSAEMWKRCGTSEWAPAEECPGATHVCVDCGTQECALEGPGEPGPCCACGAGAERKVPLLRPHVVA